MSNSLGINAGRPTPPSDISHPPPSPHRDTPTSASPTSTDARSSHRPLPQPLTTARQSLQGAHSRSASLGSTRPSVQRLHEWAAASRSNSSSWSPARSSSAESARQIQLPPQILQADLRRRTPSVVDVDTDVSVEARNTSTAEPTRPSSSADLVDLDDEDAIQPRAKRQRFNPADIIDLDGSDSDPLFPDDSDQDDEAEDEDDNDDDNEQSAEHKEWQRKQLEKPTESSTLLSDLNCVICFDQPDVLTLTPCGHMFCMDCIWRALCTGPKVTPTGGECPICRRKVHYKKLLPLQMRLADEELDELDEVEGPQAND
ncbi:hypothetical protein BZA70DRAFT_285207 [Myxozyma melibiosi]|uniref:RING-type domain-containing protein n=1 Tax=Myxozyma melibiosi TaxID=54550 RepID=A0ABR1F1A9_9ASCO